MNRLIRTSRSLYCTLYRVFARGISAYTTKTSAKTEVVNRVLAVVLTIFVPVLSIILLYTPAGSPTASAATNSTINFQARILTNTGALVPDGNYHVEFKIYDSAAAGSSAQGTCSGNSSTDDCWWVETRTTGNLVTVKNGYVTANLGSVTAFPAGMPWDQELWLAMNIGGNGGGASWDGEMSPRMKITAVPFAQAANKLQKTNGSITSNLTLASPTVGNQNFVIPDQAAAGTYNLLTENAADASYIQNQSSTPQTANFYIQSAGSSTIGAVVRGAASQSAALFTLENSSGADLAVFGANGQLTLGNDTGTPQIGSITFNDNTGSNGFTAVLTSAAALTASVTYQLPAVAAGTYDICTTAGNCLGGGDIIQNGNSYGEALFIGSNDNYDVNIETFGVARLTVQNDGDIAFDTNTLFVDAANDRVGVGNGSPGATLDVVSTDGTDVTFSVTGASGQSVNLLEAYADSVANPLLSLSQIGVATFRNSTDSTGAFRIQDSNGVNLFNVDTTNGELEVGSYNGGTNPVNGAIVLNNSTNTNTVTLQSGATSTTYSLTLPTALGGSGQCLVDTNGSGVLGWSNCTSGTGSAVLLAPASAQTDSTTNSSIYINKTGASGNILQLQKAGTDVLVLNNDGDLSVQNVIVNSTNTLQVVGDTYTNISGYGSPAEGQITYDQTNDQLLIYSNGKWQADRSDAILVAASNSSQADKNAADYVADGEDSSGSGIGTLDGDQIEINQALTAAAGKKVVLLAGTYTIDASISVPNNTTLSGVGPGTLIQFGNFGATSTTINAIVNSDTTTGTGVIVRDLKLDGRRSINTVGEQHGIYFYGMGSNLRKGGQIVNVYAERFESNGFTLLVSYFNELVNNYAYDNDTGFYISGDGNTLTGNIARGNYGNNWPTSGGFVIFGYYNTLSNNNAKSNGSIAASNYNSGFYVWGGQYNILDSNISNDNKGDGFYIGGAKNNTITSNEASGNYDYGIRLAYIGFGILESSDYNLIADNLITNSDQSSANNGVYIDQSDHNRIIGNTITDTQCDTTCYAINVSNASSDNNYLSNNVFSDTDVDDDATINDAGTGTIYAGQATTAGGLNIRYSQANSTTAFAIQNSSGVSVFNIDTTNGELEVGSYNGGTNPVNGAIVFNNSTNANTVKLQSGATTTSYTLTLPTALGNSGDCLVDTNGSGVLGWSTCAASSGVTTVGALDGGTANANGATISGSTIYLQSASATYAGLVNTSAQTFAGAKTFQADLTVNTATATDDQIAVSINTGGAARFTGTITNADLTDNRTYTLPDASGTFTLNPASGSYLQQVPTSTAANTVTPTADSVVGLTVNGTSGVAATALNVVQAGAATGLSVTSSSTGTGQSIALTNTTGTQTDGLLINRNGAGGTTTNLLNLTNTAGTATNALTFTGTFTNLINSTNFSVTNAGNADFAGTLTSGTGDAFQVSAAGAVTAVGVNSGTGLIQGNGGLTVSGATSSVNASSNFDTNINTGTSTGAVSIGNSAAGNIALQSGGTVSLLGTTTINSTGTAATTIGNSSGTLALLGGNSTSLVVGSGANTTTLNFVAPSGNNTISFPAEGGTVCLQGSSNCGFASTLQEAYDGSTGGATPEIKLDGTRGALTVQDADTTIGANLFVINDSNAANTLFSVGNTGVTTINGPNTGVNLLVADGADLSLTDGTGYVQIGASGAINLAIDNNEIQGRNGSGVASTIDIQRDGGGFRVGNNAASAIDFNNGQFTLGTTGAAVLQNSSNSAAAFAVNNNLGNTLLSVDTANSRVFIGPVTSGNTASAKLYFGDVGTVNNLWIGEQGGTDSDILQLQGKNGIQLSVNVAADTVFSLDGTGQAIFQNNANSTTAFQIQNVSGTSLFTADTANMTAIINNGAGTANILEVQDNGSPVFSIANGGVVTLTTLSGTAGTTQLCRNASNEIAACDGTGSGAAFLNGGNNFASASTLGNTSNVDLNVITNNLTRLTVEADGDIAFDTDTLFVDANNDRVGILTSTPTYDLSFGGDAARTIALEVNSANAAGSNLTIQAGAAGTGASAFAGGSLYLQGGNAAGTGNANGGNVYLMGGTGVGTGVQGLVITDTQAYETVTNATCGTNCTIAQANVDAYGAIIVEATATGLEISLPDPTVTTAGRVLYITAANGSEDFTFLVNGGGQGNEIAMRQNTTATMIWNGSDWTAAGASSSTTLQAAYDNTLTAAGGAEIVLNNTASSNGLTVRNNPNTPIIGGAIFEAQTSIGSNLFSVNNNATEYATNGGAETAGATSSTFPASTWAAAPDGGTVTRYTTLGDYVSTGQASVSVVTAATADQGAVNTLASSLTPNLRYRVSFAVRATSAFTTLDTHYSRDGTTTGLTDCETSGTVTEGIWTRIICTFDAPATGITSSNAIIIHQSDATARTFYIENLSVTVSADVNHAVDGDVDDPANFSTYYTAAPAGGTISRSQTTLFNTSGSAQVVTTAVANEGVRNNMNITPQANTQYLVSFYALSSNTFNDINVEYSRDGGTSSVACTDYNTQSVSTSTWTKISCVFTTDGTSPTNADLIITQGSATARTFWVDALNVTLNTNTASNVQIGGGNYGGPTTLFTLDRSDGPPIAANNPDYYGSMYYDTSTGRIQCYESDGWGACGSPPDNFVNLNPEYAGAVLNGSGIGTMNADLCANESGVLSVNSTLCSSGESKNYYSWTSPQASQQTYSIYVSYQLPSTFKGFSSDDTVQLTARVDNTSNAAVTYEMFRSENGSLVQCGTGETAVTSTANTWQTVGINGNEATGCGFTTQSAEAYVIFKINMKANSNANAYVSTLSFVTEGK